MPCAPASAARSTAWGVPNSVSKCSGRLGLGQEREDAAAAVVDDDERGVDAAVGRTEQAVAVVQEAEIAEQRDGRRRAPNQPRSRARSRRNRRCRSRPRLAWKVHAVARRGEALDVAHRHARRDHERGAVGKRGRRRRARSGPRTARPTRRRARRSSTVRDIGVAPRRRPSRRRPSRRARRRARRGAARGRRPCARSPRAADRARCRRDRRAPAASPGRATASPACWWGGPPTRSTRSGRCAAANAGSRSSGS